MLESIPYTVVPKPTPYNIAVFLLNFNQRQDGLNLHRAFERDFDTELGFSLTQEDVIKEIMSMR